MGDKVWELLPMVEVVDMAMLAGDMVVLAVLMEEEVVLMVVVEVDMELRQAVDMVAPVLVTALEPLAPTGEGNLHLGHMVRDNLRLVLMERDEGALVTSIIYLEA